MKTTISISAILLFACAVYGYIDYRHQKQKGNLDQLYKDEKYNASQFVEQDKDVKEGTVESTIDDGSNSTEKRPSPPAKVIHAKEFSRAALEVIEEQPVAENNNHQQQNPSHVKRTNELTALENLQAVVDDDTSVVVVEVPPFVPAAQLSVDSSKTENSERVAVHLREFSRAKFHGKKTKRTAKKH